MTLIYLSPHLLNFVNFVSLIHSFKRNLSPHWFDIVNLVTPTHDSDSDLSALVQFCVSCHTNS